VEVRVKAGIGYLGKLTEIPVYHHTLADYEYTPYLRFQNLPVRAVAAGKVFTGGTDTHKI
jgi:hypothetical protein